MDRFVPPGFNGDDGEDLEEKMEEFMREAGEYTNQFDQVRHPKHYTFGRFEVIDVLEDWFPDDPLRWQVGKYLARAGRKRDMVQDLEKAKFYLERRIAKAKEANGNS